MFHPTVLENNLAVIIVTLFLMPLNLKKSEKSEKQKCNFDVQGYENSAREMEES